MREQKAFRTIFADEGKRLLISGNLQKKAIVGINAKVRFQEIEVPEFIGDASTLEEVKQILIMQSKVNLAEYLANNPLLSTAKHSEGRHYNVTMEKQTLLVGNITSYQLALQGGLECPLTWNDTGEECELWSFEELFQLSIEIRNYVAPLTSLQQYMEAKVKACETIVDVLKVNVAFTQEAITEYYPLYLEKLGKVNEEE